MFSRSSLTAIALTSALVAQPLSASDRESDLNLERNIRRAVEGSAYFTVFDDVHHDVDDEGIVVLTGHVTSQLKRSDIASRVSNVHRVVGVQNDLDVLPASRLDNELRYVIARLIYGSSTFWHYAARRNPPIHIVVEHGHVTCEADRTMASVLASNAAARSLTNDLRLADEVQGSLKSLD